MALLWNPVPIPVFNPSTGERAGGALAYFYVGGTTTPLAVYTTDDGTTPHAWPVVADANGVFPPIFIPYGPFGYRVVTSSGAMISPVVSLIQNPAPASSGGGGSVPDTELIKTGFIRPDFGTGAMAGYVRLNARTIGNVGSGATERANDDTEALFIWLYDRLSNAICPVSGGRGANAAADFAAGKTLQLPNGRNKGLFGVDDMGNSAANGFSGVTFTVGSATAPGSQGGSATVALTSGQLPVISSSSTGSPSVTLSYKRPVFQTITFSNANPQFSQQVATTETDTNISDHVHAVPTIGGGQAHSNMSPFLLVTLYIKL